MEMSGTLRTNKGFTLVEMIVVMLIFVIVIVLTGDAFNRIVSQSLKLTTTAESNIAGVVGLELMRVDLESAGYGLPWSFSEPIIYNEATAVIGVPLNDNLGTYPDQAQNAVPRPVMSTDNVNITPADQVVVFNGSDVLTIRSQTVATNKAS